jgi:hypothetical protein
LASMGILIPYYTGLYIIRKIRRSTCAVEVLKR